MTSLKKIKSPKEEIIKWLIDTAIVAVSSAASAALDLVNLEKNNINADTLKTQRENQNRLNNELFEKLSANVNARNELGINTEYAMKQLANDVMSQMASIDPDQAEGKDTADAILQGLQQVGGAGPAQGAAPEMPLEDMIPQGSPAQAGIPAEEETEEKAKK
ncbi:unnamed protein product [Cylicocyclus nassatus]|uniref:Uncharacterized protein n=1 Tax=Cylicocyclus nassatus TaxID=53992 RepID=A0AA36GQR2_CYLNA|nr:unnamed protein product [Cylicocyclus nassatus]